MRRGKRTFLGILAILLCILSGCGSLGAAGAREQTSLWVLTEQSTRDGMNLQAEIIAERMEKENPGLTIQLDILPTDPQEREIRLKRLRTKIMAGDGPDVYLLPTGNRLLLDDDDERAANISTSALAVEPLFSDIEQAMRVGLFADTEPYYSQDDALPKEGFQRQVMAAGCVSGKRLILPLRFDIPLLLTIPEYFDRCGIDGEALNTDCISMAEYLLSRDNWSEVAGGLTLPTDTRLLSNCLDYDHERVQISVEEIARYLHTYQQSTFLGQRQKTAIMDAWEETHYTRYKQWLTSTSSNDEDDVYIIYPFTGSFEDFNSTYDYIAHGIHWIENLLGLTVYPVFTSNLTGALESVAVAKQAGHTLRMLPMRTSDNKIAAAVTYFGAVGSSCRNQELAYRFLREFLTEEFQGGLYRPRLRKKTYAPKNSQTDGQVENSWPVLVTGSTASLWNCLRYQCQGAGDISEFIIRPKSSSIGRAIMSLQITDADIPALSWEIDEVRFPVTIPGTDSLEHALSQLNEPDGTPTDADIDALAQQVYQGLWWHLAEG